MPITDHEERLRRTVERAVAIGAADLREVCVLCAGADPTSVKSALDALGLSSEALVERKREATGRAAGARRHASDLLAALPGANRAYSQWWFTLNCIERLSELIYLRSGATVLALLGASTLASYYGRRFGSACRTLDIDADIIEAMNNASGSGSASLYDVADAPPTLDPRPEAVVVDPPWYPPYMDHFLVRAAQLVPVGGAVFSTLPGPLTRPDALPQRQSLIENAAKVGLIFREIHGGAVEYSVPEFEREALRAFDKASTKPWRYADLAVFEKQSEPKEPDPIPRSVAIKTYARRAPKKFRIFFDPSKVQPGLGSPLEHVPDYSTTVSKRSVDTSKIALWTTSHVGFRVRDDATADRALSAWRSEKTFAQALAAVTGDDSARLFLDTLKRHLQLPDDTAGIRRTPAEITQLREKTLSVWAHSEPSPSSTDGYRPTFSRDRDRILWSNGIRQLANKTQVFSTAESDHVRQRLAHSMEVMQLAATIGNSIGLDRDLIEAGALAHDIGHTPFGHAGEVALDKTLKAVAPPIGGFNHYEHGLDVVVWLEDAYRHPSNGEKFGLELSPPVLECILKHTFCHAGKPLAQKELQAASKHRGAFPSGPCHLEGQAVRAADKISYLISDIEDGLRMGAITLDDLRSCRLFLHAPIDLTHTLTDDPLAAFVAQRRSLIAVLMEDVIDETARRLSAYAGPADVRSRNGYTIEHSPTICEELNEVWVRVQAGKLHKDPRVIAANRRAAHVIHRLVMVFTLRPALIEEGFRSVHGSLRKTAYLKWYRDRVAAGTFSIPPAVSMDLSLPFMIGQESDDEPLSIDDLVQAKDYVAGMTDRRALSIYHRIFGVGDSST